MIRPHLPHPRIAARFAAAFTHGVRDAIDADTLTDPAAVARWAQWQTPDQWLTEHSRKETPEMREPFFLAMQRPGRSGAVARQAGPTPTDAAPYNAQVHAAIFPPRSAALTPIDADETPDEHDEDHPADPDIKREWDIADQMGAM